MIVFDTFESLYTRLNQLLGLSFKDKAIEKRFQLEYLHDNIKQNRIAVFIGLLAYIFYYFVAYYVTPIDFRFNAFFTLPVPILLAIFFLLTTRSIKSEKALLFKLYTFAVALCLPPIVNIPITEHYQQIYIINCMLPIFAAFVMYGAPFTIALMSVVSTLIFFTLGIMYAAPSVNELIYSIFLIFTTFIIATISGYLVETNQRKNYLAKYKQESLNQLLRNEQDKLLKNEKILQQQSRLAQMGEMLGMIAHQWRQPLGAISSAIMGIEVKIQSGKFDLNNASEQKEFLALIEKKHHNINDYVQFLSTTIDDFRNFFKPEKEKELVYLTSPIERALKIVKKTMGNKGIELVTDFQCDAKVLLYQNETMQVILNILKNAEDNFIEKNYENKSLQATIIIHTKEGKDKYIISISDNGGGIPTSIIEKIFDAYFSTRLEKNGTGLGLYMSKIIIEKHNGGQLHVYNTSQGACFEILLNKNHS